MSESDPSGGCLMAAAIAFAVVFLVACIPALPFWIGGHTVWGGVAYVCVGLPMGFLVLFVFALCMAAKKGDEGPGPDDDDDDDEEGPSRPPSQHLKNRIKEFYHPSKN